MKTIFIVPGFTDKIERNPKYTWLVKFLKKRWYKVIETPVKWKKRTITDYVSDFKKFYEVNKGKENYILGFSYGAVITFISASELKPKKIFLCSLSPDFKEDVKYMKPWIIKYIGKRRFEDAKTRSAVKIAKSLTMPSVAFYGEREGKVYPDLKARAVETVKLAKKSKLVVVPKAPHDISFFSYKAAIIKEFV